MFREVNPKTRLIISIVAGVLSTLMAITVWILCPLSSVRISTITAFIYGVCATLSGICAQVSYLDYCDVKTLIEVVEHYREWQENNPDLDPEDYNALFNPPVRIAITKEEYLKQMEEEAQKKD